jgi:hypothetical protein
MLITFLIAKIILGGFWLMLAPALLFPLGIVLFSWRVLRGVFGYVAFLLAVAFAASGVIFLATLPLRDAVTLLAGALTIWWLTAAITLVARKGNKHRSPSQQLSTARSSITR